MPDVLPGYKMSRPTAEQVGRSLARVYGDEVARVFWRDASTKAGVDPDGNGSLDDLLRVGDVLTTYGGPIGASGAALVIRIRAYQILSRNVPPARQEHHA
jgi:hypothetical protein